MQEQRQSPTFQPQSPTTPPRKTTTKSAQNRYKKSAQRNPGQYDRNNNFDDTDYPPESDSNSFGNSSNSFGNNSNSYEKNSNSYGKSSNSYRKSSNSFGNTRPGSNSSNRSAGSNEIRKASSSQRNPKKQSSKKANIPSKSGFGGSNFNQFSGAPAGLGSSGLNDPEAYQTSSGGNLVPCVKCGRTFAADRVDRHQNICNNTKNRKVFDGSKHRVQGTEAAGFYRPGRTNNKAQIPKSKSNWRKNHGKTWMQDVTRSLIGS